MPGWKKRSGAREGSAAPAAVSVGGRSTRATNSRSSGTCSRRRSHRDVYEGYSKRGSPEELAQELSCVPREARAGYGDSTLRRLGRLAGSPRAARHQRVRRHARSFGSPGFPPASRAPDRRPEVLDDQREKE